MNFFIQNVDEKEKAEATFMNIQQACNRLSEERKRRQNINTQKRENPLQNRSYCFFFLSFFCFEFTMIFQTVICFAFGDGYFYFVFN